MSGGGEIAINVSIINYRTAQMTIRCAGSALEALDGLDGHVTIVDNFSGDGSAEELAAWIDSLPGDAPVSLVRSPENTGFSGGHNIGMGARRAAFHLLLNSDALVRPGAIARLLETARANPDAGIVAPRLEWEDATPQISCFRFPTPMSELIRGACSGPLTRLLKRWDVPLDLPPDPEEIGWVSFACVLLRARMQEQLGPMDEGYFLYSDDTDCCWRARQAGWRVICDPQARVVHLRGGSAPVKGLAAARKRLPAYFYASRTRLLYRMHGRAGLLAANLMWHLGRGVAQLRRLLGKPIPSTVEREARDIWINFSAPLGDRRAPENQK